MEAICVYILEHVAASAAKNLTYYFGGSSSVYWLSICELFQVAVTTKQAVAPFQANQVNAIRRRIALFDIRQSMYRDAFKKLPFFDWSCKNVYRLLDKTHLEILDLETEMRKLQEQANLFELTMSEFKPLKHARKEIKQVKQLWDYVNVVNSCIDEWKTTPWKKIDVDAMEMECKKFGKEIRAMDKELRAWDVYVQMEATIKNILTSLRAVSELQNPAIRERHWIQLMKATKVRYTSVEYSLLFRHSFLSYMPKNGMER